MDKIETPRPIASVVKRDDDGEMYAYVGPKAVNGWREGDPIIVLHADQWIDANRYFIEAAARMSALHHQIHTLGAKPPKSLLDPPDPPGGAISPKEDDSYRR